MKLKHTGGAGRLFFYWRIFRKAGEEESMGLWEILILGAGLSMDAFAVSICKGLAIRKVSREDMFKAGAWFGIFQGLMPAIGYFAGTLFAGAIESFSSWIAFVLLSLIGGNMIREAVWGKEEDVNASMGVMEMLMMAIATSIDALAVGITFSMIPVEIVSSWTQSANTMLACLIICLETAAFSAVGIKAGAKLGEKFKDKAQIAGGAVLILIGLRILLSHFGIL